MRIYFLLAMAVGASFIGSNCGGEGVGDPCVPEDEYKTGFTGFDVGEVNVESRSFQCATRVCLVNHFRGRVSCPFGQSTLLDANDQPTAVATCGNLPPEIAYIAPEDCTPELRGAGQANTCNENVLAEICPTVANQAGTACDPQCQPGGSLHAESCRVPDRDGSALADRINVGVDPQYEDRVAADSVYCSCRCDGPDPKARYCDCPSGFTCEELVDDLGLGKGQLAGSYCVADGTSYEETNPPSQDCDRNAPNCGAEFNRERVVVSTDSTSGETFSTLVNVGVNAGGGCERSGTVCGNETLCCDSTDPFNVVARDCSDVGVSATVGSENYTVCP